MITLRGDNNLIVDSDTGDEDGGKLREDSY